MECRICNNQSNNLAHVFREMMLGTRDEFKYLECSDCGTIQLLEIPELSNYYPPQYAAFRISSPAFSRKMRWTPHVIRRLAGNELLKESTLMGRMALFITPWTRMHFPYYLQEDILEIDTSSKILDFGCGVGNLLLTLNYFGFTRLYGIDKYIENDIYYENDIKVLKCDLTQLDPGFDLIMLHHSLEHLIDPLETLQKVHRLLSVGKYCVVRIPIAAYAWEKYGSNWAQLDAPRHVFVFTETGFRRIAEKAGFFVDKVIYDSDELFQFRASELYLRDIPLSDVTDGGKEMFGEEKISAWKKKAKELNAAARGDQACFLLRKM